MNIRKCFTVCAFFLALFVPLAGHAVFTQKSPTDELTPEQLQCFVAGRNAITRYVEEEFKGRPAIVVTSVKVANDFLCADPEWMMNIVVTVTDTGRGKMWYGSFHLHFLADGTFKSATSLNMEGKTWIEFHSPAEWQNEWCGFIRTVYPEDFARQCVGP